MFDNKKGASLCKWLLKEQDVRGRRHGGRVRVARSLFAESDSRRRYVIRSSSNPSLTTMSTLLVAFNGEPILLEAVTLTTTTLAQLSNQLFELTNVPPGGQKLLWKGRKPRASPESTLFQAGLRPDVKIVLMGTPVADLNDFKQAESEANRRQAVLAQRAANGPSKVCI